MHISVYLLKCCVMRMHMTIKIILAGVQYRMERCCLLPETAPKVNTKFQDDEHVVKRSENTSFHTVSLKIRNEEREV